MYDLISTTSELHYENYRMHRIENKGAHLSGVDAAKSVKNSPFFKGSLDVELGPCLKTKSKKKSNGSGRG